ncbi:NUDIX domain-containing protein [Streptomyces sp. NPDC098077]|uniref:NUDIX domain-containing protein n=1 Tax=Streptomyces sp. NPDC098077 TaxID=3366093 RepID=UPI003815C0BB
MSYVSDLRAVLGTSPLLLPGTSLLLTNGEGSLLLLERLDIAGWGLPGGLMEPGESFEETGRREAFEEIGVELGPLELLGVFSGKEYYYRYDHGDEVYNVTAAYVGQVDPACMRVNPEEIRSARFFSVTELPSGIIAPEFPIVQSFTQRSA